MEFKTICCNEEMIKMEVYNILNNDMDTIRFFCGVCGKFIDVNTYILDDEETLNEIENNEEMQNTKIHKKLLSRENEN